MSRRGRRRRNRVDKDEREISTFTNRPSRLLRPIYTTPRLRHDNLILSLDDRRHFHPDRYSSRPVKSFRKDQRNVVEHPRNVNKPLLGRKYTTRFAFNVPEKVTVCVRRRQRKEVLFAKNLMSSGRGGRRRRNEWSEVSC